MQTQAIPQAVLRPAEACAYLGISRSKLHFLSETDPTFPRKIRFSARCVGWRKTSLDSWLEAKEGGM
jgi:prophage regulatory protein